jgi:DNA-binding response OmpR family regulator
MEGVVAGSLTFLHVTRQVESSRLQLELVRRAFELLVSQARHPLVRIDRTPRPQQPAAVASRRAVSGG